MDHVNEKCIEWSVQNKAASELVELQPNETEDVGAGSDHMRPR
jgi:hypothetical protein